jgi:hypothetical protein
MRNVNGMARRRGGVFPRLKTGVYETENGAAVKEDEATAVVEEGWRRGDWEGMGGIGEGLK